MTNGAKTTNERYDSWDDYFGRLEPVGKQTSRIWHGGDRDRSPTRGAPRVFASPVTAWYLNKKTGRLSAVKQPGYTYFPRQARKPYVVRPKDQKSMKPNPYWMNESETNVATGVFINTAADGTVTTVETTMGQWGGYKNLPGKAGVFTANDMNTLIGKLREQVSGPGFNAAVTLGEGSEAYNSIAKTISDVTAAVHFARKGNMRAACRSLGVEPLSRHKAQRNPLDLSAVKPLSERFLELQYGWLPLLSDVKSAADALSHHAAQDPPVTRKVKQRLKRTVDVDRDYAENVHRTTVSVQILYSCTESNTPSVPDALGLTDPLTVAWELVPYSFVIDWFLPVGDYLQARHFVGSLTGELVISEKVTEYQAINKVKSGNFSIVASHGRNYSKIVTFSRSIVPAAYFNVPLPGLKNPVSAVHSAVASALLLLQKEKRN